ncbi:MAG: hypothetical protein ABIT05_01205 [Chitinophagaceae bacterium]
MENSKQQPKENMEVAKFDPATTYGNASNLMLTETEMKALSAPFDDLDFEITPSGFIYIPGVLTLKRLNDVIGIGRWSLLLINNGKDDLGDNKFKVFYDGAMVIRNCFVSRSVGEAQYNATNKNQSWASAFEAAKTDCRQRCSKDLGIASDAWNPTFVRRWQKEHAVKVFVDNKGSKEVAWRRKDLDPFWNEVGFVTSTPNVPGQQKPQAKPITEEWKKKIEACKDKPQLTDLYNANLAVIDKWPELKNAFFAARDKMEGKKAKA